ncbi:MAG TPA: hypothetical protein PKZ07_20125 [Sedimentisphaerales bacterium]|nr:hypothetical protein [Sedimentisphaerales bacterium]
MPDGRSLTTTNVRKYKSLPEGTKVYAIVTDYDGTTIDWWEIPVENGRAKIMRRGKNRSQYWYGR